MLRVLKWLLLIPVIILIGYIATEKADMARLAHKLTGLNVAEVGAVCAPDFEAVNPIGNRYRFILPASDFEKLRATQLTVADGWQAIPADEAPGYPALRSALSDGAILYVNRVLPHRVRWVIYDPGTGLLYPGFYAN